MKLSPPRVLSATALIAALSLAGCGGASSDPLGNKSSAAASGSASSKTIVIGSQQYYSNEIIAELYAEALELKGYTVKRQYQIGQREVYMPELEKGQIDLIPEYAGNLLQYYDKSTTAKTAEDIAAALPSKLPQGLKAFKAAAATDQDSYTVTKATADKYGLTSIGDLTKLPQPVKVAANSELAKRPYGPDGVKSSYNVQISVTPVEDSGGPLTVKALTDGTVQAADIYTADPAIAKNNLVTLTDPQHLILPQNVTPVGDSKIDAGAQAAIEAVDAKLTTDELIKLNELSVDKQSKAADIAKQWLKDKAFS